MPNILGVWKCLVCGYIHRGYSVPEICPICGASATDFVLYEDTVQPAQRRPSKWRCLICGYEQQSGEPPDTCPICGAIADEFEPVTEIPRLKETHGPANKLVVIGAGIAGVSAAEAARRMSPNSEIVVFSEEKDLPYYRLNLTRHLAGEIAEPDLFMHPQSWYNEHTIVLHTDRPISAILPDEKKVVSGAGSESYDKLVLACGAHPFVPPIPGIEKEGVFAIRTLRDVQGLIKTVRNGTSCVCIGGGILGLETAGALAKRGVHIYLLEGFDYLLPRQLNREAAQVLESYVKEKGITIIPRAKTASIEGKEEACAVLLENGTRIETNAVSISVGIRANTHLARRAGITVNQGIIVNNYMLTSHPDIYAAGDCAEYTGIVAGVWEPAQYQGTIAGQNAVGAAVEFGGIPRANTLKVLGIKLFSMGIIQPEDGSYKEVAAEENGIYRRYLFRDNYLVGAILIGDTHMAAAATRAVREHISFAKLPVQVTPNDVEEFLRSLS